MSFRDTRAAIYESALRPLERLVALALVEHLPNVEPSVSRLERFTGLERKAVMRAIAGLEASGILTVTRGDGRRSSYRFNLSLGGTGTPEGPVPERDPTSPSEVHPPVPQRDTKQTSKAGSKADPPIAPRGARGSRFIEAEWKFPDDPATIRVEAGVLDLTECRADFLDWARGTTRRYLDWRSTYRNAVRRWKRRGQSRLPPPESPLAGWAPDSASRAWPPFATRLLAFEAEENLFRRTRLATCQTREQADREWKLHVKARAVAAKGAA